MCVPYVFAVWLCMCLLCSYVCVCHMCGCARVCCVVMYVLPRFVPNSCVISVPFFSRALLNMLILLNCRHITVLACAG